jgi:hypothetical protein
MNTELTAWDMQIIADMEQSIATIETAIAAGPNVGTLIRPMIGDARPQTEAYWRAEIAQTHGWIANIRNKAA